MQQRHPNHVLDRLPRAVRDRLERRLSPVPLRVKEVIEEAGSAPAYILFPVSGLISVVVGPPGRGVEVGVIGRDGLTGTWAILGGQRSPSTGFVQIAGEALRIEWAVLKAEMDAEPVLRDECLLGASRLMQQTALTAWSNAKDTVPERLARWLLLCHDRVDSDDIPLTHEFLALMLGVRRPSVTLALQTLEGHRVIRNRRGVITIRDRRGLEKIASQVYRAPGAAERFDGAEERAAEAPGG